MLGLGYHYHYYRHNITISITIIIILLLIIIIIVISIVGLGKVDVRSPSRRTPPEDVRRSCFSRASICAFAKARCCPSTRGSASMRPVMLFCMFW